MPSNSSEPTGRPLPGEYAAYLESDLDQVAGDDAASALEAGQAAVLAVFGNLTDAAVAGVRYAPDKWTLKDILGHLMDDERIYVGRALAIARRDLRALPGFDENRYAAEAGSEARPLAMLLEEYRTVRAATIAFFRGMPREVLTRRGVANEFPVSVRGLAWHIAAHEQHHLRLIANRYLPLLNPAQRYLLETDRLGFRSWSGGDLSLAIELWADPLVTRLIDARDSIPAEEAAARLEREMATEREFGVQYWPIFLRDSGEHVGCCGLRPRNAEARIYELGFHLRPPYWKRGLAAEAAGGVVQFAFERVGAVGLFAGHHPENGASKRLLERLGFRTTGEEWYPATGMAHPSYFLAIDEYRAGQTLAKDNTV